MDSPRDNPAFHTISVPDEWSWTASGAISFVPVTLSGMTLGYLWAAAREESAGFVPAESAGAEGRNAAIAWVGRLREAKAAGDLPLAALHRWAGEPEDQVCGTVQTQAQSELPALTALDELARRD
ncbi:hypothetical protein ACFSKW_34335 [Nonomuraea mangrovi]|uniref:Uncharacterized protein n=1 Tax=Nonomuraea mangrovi TaxID=2316207 RepID=A0ABW4T3N2_9ACTN